VPSPYLIQNNPVRSFSLVLLVTLFNCSHEKNKWKDPKADKVAAVNIHGPTLTAVPDYDSCKEEIRKVKYANRKAWPRISKTGQERIFTTAITQTIIPSWIGTGWDFNGTTETPGKGKIACGYFVTTVLRDAGQPLSRVKLAQCASEQMITKLVQPKYIRRFRHIPINDFLSSVSSQGPGLYLVGLDNHTGFIHHDGLNIYFIHSTFLGTRNVQKELAEHSPILKQSRYRILGKISSDEAVLQRWIN
jgi:hypothetical protein